MIIKGLMARMKDIFVREIKYDLESIQDAKMRALDFVYPNENTTDEHKTVIENFMNKQNDKERRIGNYYKMSLKTY